MERRRGRKRGARRLRRNWSCCYLVIRIRRSVDMYVYICIYYICMYT